MRQVVARAAIAAGVAIALGACGAEAPRADTSGASSAVPPPTSAVTSAGTPGTGGAGTTTARPVAPKTGVPDSAVPDSGAGNTGMPATGPSDTGLSDTGPSDTGAIRALHERFVRMIRVSADPPDPAHPEIAATSTGIQRQRLEEARQTMLELGRRRVGGFEARITDLRFVDPDHAAVTDCELSTTDEVGPDGAVVTGHRDGGQTTELRMVRTAEGWRVEDWFTGGELSCAW